MKTLNLQQAADFLKIHPDTLRHRAAQGKIPAYKPGRAWVFDEEDLIEYIKSQKHCPSIKGQTRHIGGAALQSAADGLDAALERHRGKTRSHLRLT